MVCDFIGLEIVRDQMIPSDFAIFVIRYDVFSSFIRFYFKQEQQSDFLVIAGRKIFWTDYPHNLIAFLALRKFFQLLLGVKLHLNVSFFLQVEKPELVFTNIAYRIDS